MDIQARSMPGVGIRYDLSTRGGSRLVLIVRRDGAFELGVPDDPRDPDACRLLLHLLGDEAEALAGLLAGRRG